MFPTTLPEVLFIGILMFSSIALGRAILYFLTGLVIMFINFQNTTNYPQTIIMFFIAITLMYYAVTKKESGY